MRTSDDLPTALVNALRETRPWLTFFIVLGFIFGGLAVLGGAQSLWHAHGFWETTKAGAQLALALIYLLPTLFLSRYRRAISRVLDGGGMPALTDAVDSQKSFWRSAGTITVFMMIFAAIAIGYTLLVFAMH
jgi:hypothetical protein